MKHVLYFAKQIHFHSGKILYFNLIAMVLISILEGLGIFLLIPLISQAGVFNISDQENSLISGITSFFKEMPETISLTVILGLYVFILISHGLFQRNQTILNTKIQQSFTRYLREETYKALLQANWGFFLKNRKSDFINSMINEIARVSGGTQLLLQFIASIIFTLIQIGIAFWLSAKLTIFVMLFGLVLMFFSKRFIQKSKSFGGNTAELGKTFLGGITDHFNGIKEIKSNNLEGYHINWFHSLNQKMEDNMIEISKLKSTSQLVFKTVSGILIAILVFISIKMFHSQPAQLMLIIVIFSRLWPRFTSIQSNLEQLSSIVPSFQSLIDLQNECLKSREINDQIVESVKLVDIKYGIECRNVYFRYNKNKQTYALQNINIQIPCNQMTAIVGPSGAGKSTLIDLLMGLNRPEIGEVRIDNCILNRDQVLSLRRTISYVPQDPFLFNSSIRENLLLINPDSSEEQIWEALEFSSAAEFVKILPDGLDTQIGDRGIRLSGGERQRIVLARAILRNPQILVLDEATSALDTENERKIQAAIEYLKGKMTIIVIAHRLSTIRNADQVIVLDNGRVVQKGDFDELAMEKKGLFSKLLKSQTQVSLLSK